MSGPSHEGCIKYHILFKDMTKMKYISANHILGASSAGSN